MTLICSCLSKDVRREWPMRGECTQCHCSATQRGCFIGIMSLPTAFPVVVVARTANQRGAQTELSLFPGGDSHLLFLSLPSGQPSTETLPACSAR